MFENPLYAPSGTHIVTLLSEQVPSTGRGYGVCPATHSKQQCTDGLLGVSWSVKSTTETISFMHERTAWPAVRKGRALLKYRLTAKIATICRGSIDFRRTIENQIGDIEIASESSSAHSEDNVSTHYPRNAEGSTGGHDGSLMGISRECGVIGDGKYGL